MDATVLLYVLLGTSAGVISGTLGIGGSVIMIPVFVLLLGLTQHQAQGTALAMLVAPITLLAALTYYQNGFVDVRLAALAGVGFFVGGFLGAKLAVSIPTEVLEKIFGVALLLVAIRMILK